MLTLQGLAPGQLNIPILMAAAPPASVSPPTPTAGPRRAWPATALAATAATPPPMMELGSTPRQLPAQLANFPYYGFKCQDVVLFLSSKFFYLSVHTEIDIRAKSITSHKLTGVDSFVGEGIEDVWKSCIEVTGGASTGAT